MFEPIAGRWWCDREGLDGFDACNAGADEVVEVVDRENGRHPGGFVFSGLSRRMTALCIRNGEKAKFRRHPSLAQREPRDRFFLTV